MSNSVTQDSLLLMQLALNCCPVLFLGLLRFTAGGYKVTHLHFSLGAVVSYTISFMSSRNTIILTVFHSSRAFNQTDCSGHFWGVGTSWSGGCYRGEVRNVLVSKCFTTTKKKNKFLIKTLPVFIYTLTESCCFYISATCVWWWGVSRKWMPALSQMWCWENFTMMPILGESFSPLHWDSDFFFLMIYFPHTGSTTKW